MTGPHLTPEREADWKAPIGSTPRLRWLANLFEASPTSMTDEGLAELATGLHTLLDEREALNQTRTALQASTQALTTGIVFLRLNGAQNAAAELDAQAQENQRVLGLAVAEADKPHDGNERP